MHELDIFNGADLKKKSLQTLSSIFGKAGAYYYYVVRGIHHSEVKPHKITKSLGVEETFWENLFDENEVFEQLKLIAKELEARSKKKQIKGKTLTLKIKYKNFDTYTRSSTQKDYYEHADDFFQKAQNLWELRPHNKPIRLLGLSLSNLNINKQQASIQLKIPFPDW